VADLVRRGQLVLVGARRLAGRASSRMMSLQSSMHSSQMNTDGPGDELAHLVLALAAKRAIEQLVAGGLFSHQLGKSVWIQWAWDRSCGMTLRAQRPLLQDLIDIPYSAACSRSEEIVTVGSRCDLLDAFRVNAISLMKRSRSSMTIARASRCRTPGPGSRRAAGGS
jgi:hypothetical protein